MAWFKNTIMGLALFFSINYGIHAQSVTGKLSEFQTGKPLSGITVKVKNNTHPVPDITTTDINGNYTINKLTDVKEGEEVANSAPLTFYGANNNIIFTKNLNTKIVIGDILGRTKEKEINGKDINLNNYANGFYTITINNEKEYYQSAFTLCNGTISKHTKEIYKQKTNNTPQTNNPARLNKTLNDILVEYIEFSGTTNSGEEIETTKYDNVGTIINNGTLNVGPKTAKTLITINLTANGVDNDSGKAAINLTNYTAWTGTRDKNNPQNRFSTNGKIKTIKGNGQDTLFIENTGYHQRNLLVNNTTNQNITEYLITDKIDIDFYNYVFHGNFWPLAKPDKKYGNTPTFQIINPIDAVWEQYAKDAVTKQVAIYTGGIMNGTQTTTNPYTEVGWKSIGGLGIIATKTNATQDTMYSTKIWFLNISNPTNEQYKKDMSATTKKEIINALFNQNDIGSTTVPSSWKQSFWYQGIDRGNYIPVNYPEWTEWDLDQGRVTAKLPQGYKVNVIHKPNPQ